MAVGFRQRYCYLGLHDFYRRVYFGTAVSLRIVAGGPPRTHSCSPGTMNGVAGKLLGLVPALRAALSRLVSATCSTPSLADR